MPHSLCRKHQKPADRVFIRSPSLALTMRGMTDELMICSVPSQRMFQNKLSESRLWARSNGGFVSVCAWACNPGFIILVSCVASQLRGQRLVHSLLPPDYVLSCLCFLSQSYI